MRDKMADEGKLPIRFYSMVRMMTPLAAILMWP